MTRTTRIADFPRLTEVPLGQYIGAVDSCTPRRGAPSHVGWAMPTILDEVANAHPTLERTAFDLRLQARSAGTNVSSPCVGCYSVPVGQERVLISRVHA